MRPLSASQLVSVWERGQAEQPAERALLLLAVAFPDKEPEELARLSVGRRDACLLTLRESALGGRLASLVSCIRCGERLEMTLDVAQIRAQGPDIEATGALSLEAGGLEVQFRLPDTTDLIAMRDASSAEQARRILLERCVLSAPADLPDDAITRISDAMEQADPQANVEFAFECPRCGYGWRAIFDIATFFWSELEAAAQRLLREVHALASAYHWREAEILAMSPVRRQFYLDMVTG